MIENIKLGFLGSGLMAESIIKMMLEHKTIAPENIFASGPRKVRAEELENRYGVKGLTDNLDLVGRADFIILSVKPQTLPKILQELEGKISSHQTLISIIAGAKLSFICDGVGHGDAIRVMTNTPAQIGEAMSVWVATARIDQFHKDVVRSILSSFGKELEVQDELFIDKATGISGPGPAYLFLFIEALIDATVRIGFERKIAKELVLQTVLGSSLLMKETGKHPAELRNMVASPGGPCAAALQALERDAFRGILGNAVWVAYQRCLELGKEVEVK